MVRFSTFILHPLVPGGRVFFELEGAWMATLLHELTRGRTAAAGERSTEEAARSAPAEPVGCIYCTGADIRTFQGTAEDGRDD